MGLIQFRAASAMQIAAPSTRRYFAGLFAMTRNLVALGCELDRMPADIRNDSNNESGNLAVESQGALDRERSSRRCVVGKLTK
jgi:hypothetical protein